MEFESLITFLHKTWGKFPYWFGSLRFGIAIDTFGIEHPNQEIELEIACLKNGTGLLSVI